MICYCSMSRLQERVLSMYCAPKGANLLFRNTDTGRYSLEGNTNLLAPPEWENTAYAMADPHGPLWTKHGPGRSDSIVFMRAGKGVP